MAARIRMQLLCIKLSFISQKQRQICDKLSFKLSFTALNPDSVGKFVGKTSGTFLQLSSPYQVPSLREFARANSLVGGAGHVKCSCGKAGKCTGCKCA